MMTSHTDRRGLLLHALALSLIGALWLTAWSAFHGVENGRSWWWFSGNDACQGFSAQSVSMRLGSPIQTVVWPGATLPVPYLYATLFRPTPAPGSLLPASTEAILAKAVHFHWTQAAIYGLLLLALVYLLAFRWSRSPVLALLAAGLVATNEWFLFGLFHVRAEVPSLVFALAACGWATWNRPRLWPNARPIVFGSLVTLAVLSKIQIVPALPLCIFLYWQGAPDEPTSHDTRRRWIKVAGLIATCALVVVAMIRTPAIDGSAYGLPALPSAFAHVVVGIASAALSLTAVLSFSRSRRVASTAISLLLMGCGAATALAVMIAPVLMHGGTIAALTTANRIMFGTLSFARYGLQLESGGGWGRKEGVIARATSFFEFQSSSMVIAGNLALITSAVVAGCLLVSAIGRSVQRRSTECCAETPSQLRQPETWLMSIAFLSTAVASDLATTHRTVSTTSYAFYHIMSVPFYILAACCAVAAVRALGPARLLNSPQLLGCALATMVAAGVWLVGQELATNRLKLWQKPAAPIVDYFKDGNPTRVIWGVSPDFGRQTGQTYEGLRDFVFARDKAAQDAKDAAAKSK